MSGSSPYRLRPIEHVSATALKDYSTCEAMSAYRRNFELVVELPPPVAMVYGIVFHFLGERMAKHFWKLVKASGRPIDAEEGKRYISWGRIFLSKVLDGVHGPRGENDKPVVIRWFPPRKRMQMNDREYAEAVKEERNQLLGRVYNALEAYRLEFTQAMPYADLLFELNFSRYKVPLQVPFSDSVPVVLNGQIDRVQVWPNNDYEVLDFKTGWIVQEYRKRVNLVDDLQMTIYDFVSRVIFGRPPKALHIQPMDIATEKRKQLGAKAMASQRITLPPRTQQHFDDLALLAVDVFQMAELVANSHLHSRSEREEWEPQSSYGRKAQFVQNVREERFVPRIGPWCDTCMYQGLCQKDHKPDWDAFEQSLEVVEAQAVEDTLLPAPREEEDAASTGWLFEAQPVRSRYVRKPDRIAKNEMIESKQFLPKKSKKDITGFVPMVNKVLSKLKAHGSCPCTKYDLVPLWLIPHIPDIHRGTVSLAAIASQCPHKECPRNKKEEIPA